MTRMHARVVEGRRGERRLYLRKYLQQGRRVASFAPSSRHLAAATCRGVDPGRPQWLLELGAGTGSITRAAAARMHPDSRLIAVERDPDFAALAARAAPRAEVVVADVADLEALLHERGISRLDGVLSGLPTPSLPPALRERVFAVLAERGGPWVSQITVMPWVYYGLYRRFFRTVAFEPVWRNLPPGGVYHCRGPRCAAATVVTPG
ncbi:methyltransferase domain-containing protein [Arhodomonas aquaeolei]|uniref:methyltransferase domain-containing protein n=1 Tax=Arhodomonas aquaeolei TaxID=2369 RepID=UPI002166F3ED|nr:methyltransferase domain-containing protein [Arhodomonas aquaeolei]MCS4504806.1 methyltransferase domain-containing protein [Arhodomonas aquaeolei]